MNFYVKPFLKAHPQFDWEKPILRNMIAYPRTEFQLGEKAAQYGWLQTRVAPGLPDATGGVISLG